MEAFAVILQWYIALYIIIIPLNLRLKKHFNSLQYILSLSKRRSPSEPVYVIDI